MELARVSSEDQGKKAKGSEAAMVSQITKSVKKSLLNHFKGSQGARNNNQKRNRSDSSDACDNCGKQGHSHPDCRANGGGAVGVRPDWYKSAAKKQNGGNKVRFNYPLYSDFLEQGSFTFKKSLVSTLGSQKFDNMWISDSACSAFVTCRLDWLSDFESINEVCQTAHSDSTVVITGKGKLHCRMNGSLYVIPEVFYSSDFGFNLFPVKYFDKKGCTVTYGNGEVVISNREGVVGTGSLHESGIFDGLYVLDLDVVSANIPMTQPIALATPNIHSSSPNPPITTPESNVISDQVDQFVDSIENQVDHSILPPTAVDHEAVSIQKFQCLHRKLGHLHARALKDLIKSGKLPTKLTDGIDLTRLNS